MNSASSAAVVAIFDDEPDILDMVTLHLEKAGFNVHGFPDPATFVPFIKSHVPDLVVLDLMLPGINGIELCKMMRQDDRLAAVPIVMFTALADEAERVLGLEVGADDYITKPCSINEFLARVKAVLRRTRPHVEPRMHLVFGGILEIDSDQMAVSVRKEPVELTHTEYRILALLASRPGCVFSHATMLDHLWKHEEGVVDRTVDAHVKNLRGKLRPGWRRAA